MISSSTRFKALKVKSENIESEIKQEKQNNLGTVKLFLFCLDLPSTYYCHYIVLTDCKNDEKPS